MKLFRTSFVVAAVLALGATAADAQSVPARQRTTVNPDVTARGDFAAQSNSLGPIAPRSIMQWDARRGRWGLKLEVDRPRDRDMQGKDMAVGGYYRLTPRLHVGGAVSLGEDAADNLRKVEPQQAAPRVRLETTFKF